MPAQLIRGLLHLVYPPLCLICETPLGDTRTLCPSCDDLLCRDPSPTCPRCAANVGPYSDVTDGCTVCRGEVYHFARAFRLGQYDGLLRDVVLRLKHASGENLAEWLGECWAERDRALFLSESIDLVVPVPLHFFRRWQRGYNQSAALAYGLARGLALPWRPWALKRTRWTPFQTMQTRENRYTNVHGAFTYRGRHSLRGKCVLLVDDVLTTGSTLSEAARALRVAGAGRVVAATLTRSRT
jgi:ComF family protein